MSNLLDWDSKDIFYLSSIKRWGVIDMSRDQSVAEHSYHVAIIAMEIGQFYFAESESPPIAELLKWSLTNDLPELLTGDIPTPAKQYIDLHQLDKENFPEYTDYKEELDPNILIVVKAADYIEALRFCVHYCCDTRREEVIADIISNFRDLLDENPLLLKSCEEAGLVSSGALSKEVSH